MKYKLIVLTLLVGILPLALAGLALNAINQTALRSNIKELHAERAGRAAELAEKFLADTIASIKVSLYNKDFEEMPLAERRNYLEFLLQQYPQIQIITVLDSDRVPIATALHGDETSPARYRKHLETVPGFPLSGEHNKERISGAYLAEGADEVLIALGLPLKSGRELLVAEIAVGGYLRRLTVMNSKGKSSAYFVDDRGRLLAHPGGEPALSDRSGNTMVRTLLEIRTNGSLEFEDGGEAMVGSFAVTSSGWGAVIQEPRAAVFAPAVRMQIATLAFMALGVTLAVGGGLLFADRFVVRPIAHLTDGARELGRGNLEFEFHIPSRDEVGDLARAFNVMSRDLKRAQSQLIAQELVKQEMSIAVEIQKTLLPESDPAVQGFNMGSLYQAARDVGGDYYDYIAVDDRRLGILVADVSGKGVPGAMVMTMARSVIRSRAPGNLSPAAVLAEANELICRDIKRGMFISVFYVVLDLKTGEMRYASGGHNPMIVRRAGGAGLEFLKPKGMALGLRKSPFFDKILAEGKTQLDPGDMALLYTDGVNEAMDPEDNQYGNDRLNACVVERGGESAARLVEAISDDVRKFVKGNPQSDDITLVAIQAEKSV